MFYQTGGWQEKRRAEMYRSDAPTMSNNILAMAGRKNVICMHFSGIL